jgi:hypothetical protein
MYAVTSTSYRAIASADDLGPGETAVTEIPASTLEAIASSEARIARDSALRACDWTVGIDAPLTANQVAAWKAYRQALRDVPEQAGFPSSIDWPATPAT